MATYTDVDPTFSDNPFTTDIAVATDTQAIINSCKNLVLTPFKKRLFQPNLGSGIEDELFELATPITSLNIKDKIENVIKTYEPRVESVTASVVVSSDQSAYNVTIVILPRNSLQTVTFTIALTRII